MHEEIGRARGSPLTLGLSTDRRGGSTACLSVDTETGDLPDFPNSRPNSREDSERTSVYSILGRAAASWTRILLRGVCSVLLMDDQILQGPRAAEGDPEGDQVQANQRSNLPAQTMTPEENQERAPEFLLPTEPRHRALWEGTKVLCSRSQSIRYPPLPLFFGLSKGKSLQTISRAFLFCSAPLFAALLLLAHAFPVAFSHAGFRRKSPCSTGPRSKNCQYRFVSTDAASTRAVRESGAGQSTRSAACSGKYRFPSPGNDHLGSTCSR